MVELFKLIGVQRNQIGVSTCKFPGRRIQRECLLQDWCRFLQPGMRGIKASQIIEDVALQGFRYLSLNDFFFVKQCKAQGIRSPAREHMEMEQAEAIDVEEMHTVRVCQRGRKGLSSWR